MNRLFKVHTGLLQLAVAVTVAFLVPSNSVCAWQVPSGLSSPRIPQHGYRFSFAGKIVQPPQRRTSSSLCSAVPTSSDTSSSRSASASRDDNGHESSSDTATVPITLLAGFLGSGKTTTLQHLLENTLGIRVGVIVNDVASVNIDAKLVSSSPSSSRRLLNDEDSSSSTSINTAKTRTAERVIELQNGCACCSLADELFFSVDTILERDDRPLDIIVVELSGVADPTAIQKNWLMAPDFIRNKAHLSRIVTLVDASTFGTDFLTLEQARQRKGWVGTSTSPSSTSTSTSTSTSILMDPSGMRKVSELLAEQVEAANVVLLNKIDLATEQEQQVALTVVKALNPNAEVKHVEYGMVSADLVLGTKNAFSSLDDEQQLDEACNEMEGHGVSDSKHSHSHHGSDNNRHNDIGTVSACNDADCNDTSHSHSHDHHLSTNESSSSINTCDDPDCNDQGHDHSRSHGHSHSHSSSITSTDQLGITNFVFEATCPFHPVRLAQVLNDWPVPVKDTLDLGFFKDQTNMNTAYRSGQDDMETSEKSNPFVGVLRSKGYCWVAPNSWEFDPWRHDTKVFWSHAGKSFGLKSEGKWWDALGLEEVKKYFVTNMDAYHKIVEQDFVSEEFGDRRNELVFIGVNLDEKRIRATLEECLCSEEEMKKYRKELRGYQGKTLAS